MQYLQNYNRCPACVRMRELYGALAGISEDDLRCEYKEACALREMWTSLEAAARALSRNVNHDALRASNANADITIKET